MRFLEVMIEDPKARVVFSHYDPPWRKNKPGMRSRAYSASVHTADTFGHLKVVHFQADIIDEVADLVQLYLDNLKTVGAGSPAVLSKVSSSELEAFLE